MLLNVWRGRHLQMHSANMQQKTPQSVLLCCCGTWATISAKESNSNVILFLVICSSIMNCFNFCRLKKRESHEFFVFVFCWDKMCVKKKKRVLLSKFHDCPLCDCCENRGGGNCCCIDRQLRGPNGQLLLFVLFVLLRLFHY